MNDTAGVIAPPPLIALGAIAIGFGLEAIWPIALPARDVRIVTGIGLFVLAAALAGWAMMTFIRAGTNVPTRLPSTTIVATGPYRISRNPIYVAMATAIAGVGVAAGSAWVIAMVIPFIAIIGWGVVAREERYLEGKFGDSYRIYRERIRRWI